MLWNDIALSSRGEREAENAGRLLKDGGYTFDICLPRFSGARTIRNASYVQQWVWMRYPYDRVGV